MLYEVITILIYAYNYWAPIVLVPLVAAIYGYRRGTLAFVAGAMAGLLTATFWNNILGKPAYIDGLV